MAPTYAPSTSQHVRTAMRSTLAAAEDHDAGHRPRAAHVVRQPELGLLHLSRPRLAPELRHALVDHADAARSDRMAEGLEPAARVHGNVPVERRSPLLHQPASLSLRAETEILGVRDLGPGEAIVHLGEVDVTRADAGHRVGLAGGGLRGAEAEVVERRVEVRTPRRDRQ